MFFVITTIILALLLIIIFLRRNVATCKSYTCLVGKTALITGGNSGIGYQTALALAGRGCRVIIADKDNCEESKEKIIEETGNNNVVIKQFNLSSFRSVRELANDINKTEERLDILINNAGAMGFGSGHTEDGLHIGMQVNHFGPFLLTHLLVVLLKKSAPSRIIFVSSRAAIFSNLTTETLNLPEDHPATASSEYMVYANSKLCNLITSNEFARRLEGFGITCNSVHPGTVNTPFHSKYAHHVVNNKLLKQIIDLIGPYSLKLFGKSAEEGAQTSIHVAVARQLEKVTGKFFADCEPCKMPSKANNLEFSIKIWEASEAYVKLVPREKL